MPSVNEIFRFAPSPNGYLHRGHAFSAMLNWQAANRTGGRFLLRIEDIDRGRAREEYEAAIYQDLAWLGLTWQPEIVRQSERLEAYRAAIAELDRLGLLYPGFLTRREIRAAIAAKPDAGAGWPRDPDGAPLYPGLERDWPEAKRRTEMTDGRPYALRIDMQRVAAGLPSLDWREENPFDRAQTREIHCDPSVWGDIIIARSDNPASYHLSVVVDDAFQSVSQVIRGVDLAPSTSVHRTLQHLLGLPSPNYFHHRLLLDDAGEKLSKRFGSRSLREERLEGVSSDDIVAGLRPYLMDPAPPPAAESAATPPS